MLKLNSYFENQIWSSWPIAYFLYFSFNIIYTPKSYFDSKHFIDIITKRSMYKKGFKRFTLLFNIKPLTTGSGPQWHDLNKLCRDSLDNATYQKAIFKIVVWS